MMMARSYPYSTLRRSLDGLIIFSEMRDELVPLRIVFACGAEMVTARDRASDIVERVRAGRAVCFSSLRGSGGQCGGTDGCTSGCWFSLLST